MLQDSSLEATSRYAVRSSGDKSQMSCLCRTVAPNIQLISDTHKKIHTVCILLSPVHIFFYSSVQIITCTHHRIEEPYLLDYSYLVFTHFLFFFDDCHTHWQAIRVPMLPVTKKFFAATSQVSSTVQDKPIK